MKNTSIGVGNWLVFWVFGKEHAFGEKDFELEEATQPIPAFKRLKTEIALQA